MTGPGPETDALTPLIRALGFEDGWLIAAASWIATLRVAFKPFSIATQARLADVLARVVDSPEQDDDAIAIRLLTSRAYRLTAFGLDLLASVKLPGTADLRRAVAARNATPIPVA